MITSAKSPAFDSVIKAKAFSLSHQGSTQRRAELMSCLGNGMVYGDRE
jgi:hypothetical protein